MLIFGLFLAGGFGAVSRYILSAWFSKQIHTARLKYLSIGLVNMMGSMLFGGVHTCFEINQAWYIYLGLGFCGAFTTFSSFSYEVTEMLLQKQYQRAGFYILFTIVLCCFFYQMGAWILEEVVGSIIG